MLGAPDMDPIANIFRYTDFRRLLRDYYQAKKRERRGFSYRSFARRAGLRSPNHLKRVIEGERKLGVHSVEKYCRALGLSGESSDYFFALVAFNQSTTRDERQAAYQRMLSFRSYRSAHYIDARYAAYYSQWYVPVIREMALREDFCEDPGWIAKRTCPPISVREASKALQILFDLRMLARNGEGRVVITEPVVTTGAQTRDLHIATYHRAMLKHAEYAILNIAADERFVASLTFCVGDDGFERIRDRIQRFRQELVAILAEEQGGTNVLQLGVQLFPVATKEPSS